MNPVVNTGEETASGVDIRAHARWNAALAGPAGPEGDEADRGRAQHRGSRTLRRFLGSERSGHEARFRPRPDVLSEGRDVVVRLVRDISRPERLMTTL